MSEPHDPTGAPLFDRARIRRAEAAMHAELATRPEQTTATTRARIRVVREFVREAQIGRHLILSDEAPPLGTGIAASPWQYFVAAVGFCLLSQVTRVASLMDVAVEAAELDIRGSFPWSAEHAGGSHDIPVAMERLTWTLDVKSAAPAELVLELVRRAEAGCYLSASVRAPVPVEGKLRLNGMDLGTV